LKHLFITLFSFLASSTLLAYDAEINGIYYNFSGDEAEVTYRTENAEDSYAGDVVIPESVTYMDKEYRVTSIGSKAFYRSSGMASVTIPKSVNVVKSLAFMSCTSLTNIIIPNSVEGIHERVFENCENLKSVTLSKILAHLGEDAFWNCSNLEEMVCKSEVPPATLYIDKVAIDRPGGVFYNVNKQNCKLYVPKGCEEAYKAAELWKDFNIVEKEMGINEVTEGGVKSEKSAAAIFNLSGQRMSKAQKGINIVRGKKVLY